MKAHEQIKKLSIEEKVALLQGKTVWTTYSFEHADVPEIFLSDGPHGLRKKKDKKEKAEYEYNKNRFLT